MFILKYKLSNNLDTHWGGDIFLSKKKTKNKNKPQSIVSSSVMRNEKRKLITIVKAKQQAINKKSVKERKTG